MKRRTFVRGAAAGALAAGLVSRFDLARAASDEPQACGADKLGRIAVTTWSLHAFFPQTKEAGLDAKGEALQLRRFPELVATGTTSTTWSCAACTSSPPTPPTCAT